MNFCITETNFGTNNNIQENTFLNLLYSILKDRFPQRINKNN